MAKRSKRLGKSSLAAWRLLRLVSSGAVVLGLGCAPSHRMVHAGNVTFERCYSGDFNPKVSPEQREACWNAWLAHYTRHQAAHRVDYAMRRVEALEGLEPTLSLPGLEIPGSPPMQVSGLDAATTRADGTRLEGVTTEGPRAGAEVATLSAPDAARVEHGCERACSLQAEACQAACPADARLCKEGCRREKALCKGGCY